MPNNPTPRMVVLGLDHDTVKLWNDIEFIVLNEDHRDFLMFSIIEWMRKTPFEDLDVTAISGLVMEFIIRELTFSIGSANMDRWYREYGLTLRTKLILFTLRLKDLLHVHHLYGPEPAIRTLQHAYISARGRDALLLAYAPV